jgi:hypothetical protein
MALLRQKLKLLQGLRAHADREPEVFAAKEMVLCGVLRVDPGEAIRGDCIKKLAVQDLLPALSEDITAVGAGALFLGLWRAGCLHSPQPRGSIVITKLPPFATAAGGQVSR